MIRIRTMLPKDIPTVIEIEKAAFSDPWNELDFYAELLYPDVRSWVAIEKRRVCAYLIFQIGEADLHIHNIAVIEVRRRHGIGGKLFDKMLRYARRYAASALTLEVSENNTAAAIFYAKQGFEICGREEGYYSGETSAALHLIRKLEKY
ncbi:MAG: ribosomal protein S18-alanine N-acetyltransferase [Candidatus Neomarinimicrobiota bacterium]|nr:ribosomal protein S18-alanine N-acetyltransferase [Candidatus Neomarinimicrobiota bacterium]MDD3965722.1 ribosomal protein S18-alanine N-acetyltransferase [Candidatus Neomarinimicrobiota bacterium]MDX9779580.1 ribosomal protein S18-alanine N-acetyltransferase [bacterium]